MINLSISHACMVVMDEWWIRAEEMGFLESCFSYIFGDGDPNANLDDEK